MTELKSVDVHLVDVEKAVDLVCGFIANLSIPANEAYEWAATAKVLAKVKGYIKTEIAKLPPKEEVAA